MKIQLSPSRWGALSLPLACCIVGAAAAQSLTLPASPPASPPKAQVGPVGHAAHVGHSDRVEEKSTDLGYQSVLGRYQGYVASDITSWPKANATVQGIGGWRAYAKEIEADKLGQPQPAEVAPAGHSHGGRP